MILRRGSDVIRCVNLLLFCVAVGMLVLAFSGEACGYIDPGTGSLILQVVIAGLVGAGFAISVFWQHIKAFVVRLFSKKQREDSRDDTQ